MPQARHHRVESFPPQVAPDCVLLILGTVPSVRSLELRQSYGHRFNLFWPFMGVLFGAGPSALRRAHPRGCSGAASASGTCSSAASGPAAWIRRLSRAAGCRTTFRAFNCIDDSRDCVERRQAQQSFRRHIAPRLGPTCRLA
jgi:hypothetical protein